MSRGMKENTINVPLPRELAEKVEQEAQCRLTSKAAIVREALLAYFARHQNLQH